MVSLSKVASSNLGSNQCAQFERPRTTLSRIFFLLRWRLCTSSSACFRGEGIAVLHIRQHLAVAARPPITETEPASPPRPRSLSAPPLQCCAQRISPCRFVAVTPHPLTSAHWQEGSCSPPTHPSRCSAPSWPLLTDPVPALEHLCCIERARTDLHHFPPPAIVSCASPACDAAECQEAGADLSLSPTPCVVLSFDVWLLHVRVRKLKWWVPVDLPRTSAL